MKYSHTFENFYSEPLLQPRQTDINVKTVALIGADQQPEQKIWHKPSFSKPRHACYTRTQNRSGYKTLLANHVQVWRIIKANLKQLVSCTQHLPSDIGGLLLNLIDAGHYLM